MSVLEKATLQEIPSGRSGKPKEPIEVQFNPTTLKLKLSNKNEGGRSRGRQVRQHVGASSTVLSMDLIFDTADEGTTDNPVSVHTKTALVEKFVLPKKDGKDAPPRLRFHWGNLIVDGIVESIDIDFDHFAPSGVPLRAKVSLSIEAQDPKYEFKEAGAGSNTKGNARDPGEPGAGAPGGTAAPSDRSAPALAGEMRAEFAARMGLDPQAWRGLDTSLSAGLTLEAGVDVGFNAELNASGGIGVRAGIQVGVGASLEASFGLEASAGEGARQGFALSAAGGVNAAIESVRALKSAQAAGAAKAAFAASGATSPTTLLAAAAIGPPVALPGAAAERAAQRPGLPPQERTPLVETGIPSAARNANAAPRPPRADPRAATFGFGVPLRARVGGRAAAPVVLGAASAAEVFEQGGVPVTRNPFVPPWVQLPERGRGESAAAKRERPLAKSCGCQGPCGCPGAKS